MPECPCPNLPSVECNHVFLDRGQQYVKEVQRLLRAGHNVTSLPDADRYPWGRVFEEDWLEDGGWPR